MSFSVTTSQWPHYNQLKEEKPNNDLKFDITINYDKFSINKNNNVLLNEEVELYNMYFHNNLIIKHKKWEYSLILKCIIDYDDEFGYLDFDENENNNNITFNKFTIVTSNTTVANVSGIIKFNLFDYKNIFNINKYINLIENYKYNQNSKLKFKFKIGLKSIANDNNDNEDEIDDDNIIFTTEEEIIINLNDYIPEKYLSDDLGIHLF